MFEEFEPGESVETAGRTITEADIVMFAGLSGDYTELHTNEEFARGDAVRPADRPRRIGVQLSVGLTTRTNLLDGTMVAFSRVDNLRFTRPVFIGDTIHVSKRLLATDVKGPDAGHARVRHTGASISMVRWCWRSWTGCW